MRFEVNVGTATTVSSNLQQYGKTLSSIQNGVAAVKRQCAINGNNGVLLQNALESVRRSIEKEAASTNRLRQALTKTASLYRSSEKKVLGNAKTLAFEKSGSTGTAQKLTSKESKKTEISWKDLIFKVIGKGGVIGGLFSAIASWATGDGSAKNGIISGKYLMSALGNVCSAVSKKGTSAAWGYLIGVNDAFDGIDTSSAWEAFKSYWSKQGDDLDFAGTGAKTVSGKLKVATKWGGYLLDLAKNGVENYDEYKTRAISAERAVEETIVETGVDIGLGIASTAAVTAAAAALGVTSAPAVVIGGIAAGAVWGANAVCKWATGGRDIGEVVADAACDAKETVVKWAQSAQETIVNTAQSIWTGGVNAVKSAFSKWRSPLFA